jgi:RNA polymerase sigma-70 factor (ECF subfamily)
VQGERITYIQPDRKVDDIIRQCKAGDSRAFAHLVRSHQAYAFTLAFRMLSDEDEASDIVQESFIRVWKNMNRYDPSQKFTTWLYAIVSRLCLDRIQSLARFRKLFRREDDTTGLEWPYDPTDPEKVLTNREIATIIEQLAGDLSPTQRLVFTLRDLQQCTIEEVCEITGLSNGSVKTNLSYARRRIRHRLVQQYDITGSQP